MEVGGRLAHVAPRVKMTADEFRELISEAFLGGYERAARGSPVWVEDPSTRRNLLKLHLLAKAFYEIAYEADNRPDWIGTPVRGVLRALDEDQD
jgi:maltose alpha-D-glucosyltransferase/alpha-amylase